jgi:hypothetical protein
MKFLKNIVPALAIVFAFGAALATANAKSEEALLAPIGRLEGNCSVEFDCESTGSTPCTSGSTRIMSVSGNGCSTTQLLKQP